MSRTFPVSTRKTNAAEPAGALGVTGSAIKPSLIHIPHLRSFATR
jgi:hypothetical protein